MCCYKVYTYIHIYNNIIIIAATFSSEADRNDANYPRTQDVGHKNNGKKHRTLCATAKSCQISWLPVFVASRRTSLTQNHTSLNCISQTPNPRIYNFNFLRAQRLWSWADCSEKKIIKKQQRILYNYKVNVEIKWKTAQLFPVLESSSLAAVTYIVYVHTHTHTLYEKGIFYDVW